MKTILVIDDEAEVRQSLSAVLRRHRWQVIEAATGDQGIELARKHLPEAILCDLFMPGTNGFRVCAAVRANRTLRYSLVLAMSGRAFEDNRRSALEAGADDFLPKPIDTAHLMSLLDRMTAPAADHRLSSRSRAPGGMASAASPFVRFWGVRGSVPVPGPETVRYGGNTACVEVRAGGEIVILDSGTGIRPLGEALSDEFPDAQLHLTLLVTHAHWDHVQGFPFFKPLYNADVNLRVLGYDGGGETLAAVFSRQMETPFFPIGLAEVPAHVQFEELHTMDFTVGAIKAQVAFVNHPGVCVGYRLTTDQGSVAFVPDHEPFHRTCFGKRGQQTPGAETQAFARAEDERILSFLQGVDLLILDSQFAPDEYPAHIGWGHSSVDDAVDLALRAQAKRLFLFHHHPSHDDARMDQIEKYARALAAKAGTDLEVDAAREGVKVDLPALASRSP